MIVKYGKNIKTKPQSPISSTERLAKHVKELTEALDEEERAILLIVNQYIITEKKPFQKSTQFKKMQKIMKEAIDSGIEIWNLELKFTKDGVKVHELKETTDEVLVFAK